MAATTISTIYNKR